MAVTNNVFLLVTSRVHKPTLLVTYYDADIPEVAVELEDMALGESAVSESGHHSDHDDDKSGSERSEISNAPSVEHFNISVSN